MPAFFVMNIGLNMMYATQLRSMSQHKKYKMYTIFVTKRTDRFILE